MVRKVRKIMMSLDEVCRAYECYQRVTPDFLPKAGIIACKTADGAVILTVERTDGASSQRQEIIFKGFDIFKPLIRFCIENNILLPRDGTKSISIEADKVVLHMELDLSVDMPTALRPMNMSHVDEVVLENKRKSRS